MDLDETWQVGLRPEKTKPCTFPANSRYRFRRQREKWVADRDRKYRDIFENIENIGYFLYISDIFDIFILQHWIG